MQQFGVGSRKLLVLNKFEYSHYLFAGWCTDIGGRSYVLITSESSSDKGVFELTDCYWFLVKMPEKMLATVWTADE